MEQIPESRMDKWHRLSQRLQKTAMFVMAFMVLLTFMMTNLLAIMWQSSDWLVGAVLPGVVTTLTNTERAKYNVAPLSRNTVLDAAAQMKAEHMAAEEYFAHDSPGGLTPWYWFEQAGYVYAHAGENLAVHFQDSDEVVKAWMNSPTHKANVVGSQYTEIGIGTAKGRYKGYDTVFVVQLFGTPAKRPVVVPPEPVVVTEVPNIDSLAVAENEALAIAQREEARANTDVDELVAPNGTDSPSYDEDPILQESYGTIEEPGEVEGSFITISEESPGLAVVDLMPTSFVATSSGLPPSLESREFVAQTSTPALSTLATKPRTILQGVYMVIGTIVLLLLIISIILGYRSHHIRPVLAGVGLLMLMSVLFVWHIAVTGGAVVA